LKIALWGFYLFTAFTLWRSQHHLFSSDGDAQSIATIPLDAYPASAASTVIGIFVLWGLSQLIIGLVYLIAAIRYRSMVPLLYLLSLFEYLMRATYIPAYKSIETAGTAPGAIGNLPLAAFSLTMLVLILWPRDKKEQLVIPGRQPTKRAPAVWDTPQFISTFLTSGFSSTQTESTRAHTQVKQTVESQGRKEHMTDDKQPTATPDSLTQTVVRMAVESWRFGRVFDRLLLKLDAGEQNRYKSQFRWFIKQVEEALEQAHLRIVNVEGHPFDPGMAATPLNIEEFDAKDILVVDQMLEPIIMGEEGLVKTGTVTLRKVEL